MSFISKTKSLSRAMQVGKCEQYQSGREAKPFMLSCALVVPPPGTICGTMYSMSGRPVGDLLVLYQWRARERLEDSKSA